MDWLSLPSADAVLALAAALTLGGFLGFFLRGWVEDRQQKRRKRALGRLLSAPRPAPALFAPPRAPRDTDAAEPTDSALPPAAESIPAPSPMDPPRSPAGPSLTPPSAPVDGAAAARGGGTATILVVDDRLELRAVHTAYLESHGYRVLEAGDGDSALEVARRHHPNAILLDHSLPKRTGLQVALELKSDGATADIPIVFMTAHSYGAVGANAIAAGCAAFLPKPCEPSRVLKEILRLAPLPPAARA